MRSLRLRLLATLLLPYFRNEWPGWGLLLRTLSTRDDDWGWASSVWVRGKLHGYEMLLDLRYWSNRVTFLLGRYYDLPTQIVLQRTLRTGDVFVDIGANEGMVSLLGSRLVGGTGRVISFEPNPSPRRKFEAAIRRNGIQNIELHSVALGATEAVLTLNAPAINTGEGSFGRSTFSSGGVETIECKVVVGDNMFLDRVPRLIKIDVEGYEYQVIVGLAKTIDLYRPAIVMEIISEHLELAGSSPAQISDFMNSKGYKAFRLRLSGRKGLSLMPCDIRDGINGDFLWQHSENQIMSSEIL